VAWLIKSFIHARVTAVTSSTFFI